jgi:hypothetical protein
MANLTSNPWSLTNADVVGATPVASPNGLVLNADGTVTLTTTAPFTVTVNATTSAWVTVINATNALYNGFYKALIGSGGTVFTLAPQFTIPAGTAGSGGGAVAQVLYRDQVRVEDISWQNATAAGDTLDLRDRTGRIVWQATATATGSQNRGKVFWINGLTPIVITSGVVILTID